MRKLDDEESQPDGAHGRRRRADAGPRVETDVMMVAARRDEQRARAIALHQIESQHIGIEPLSLVQVRHVQMHVPDDGAAGEAGACPASRVRQQPLQIEWIRAHAQVVANEWPLDARSIAIDLDAVAVRIGEVDRLADAVVRGALQDRAGLHEPAYRLPQIGARWRQYREMVKAGRASCSGRVPTLTQNKQIRAAGPEPGDALIATVHDESKSGLVELDRSFEIRDRQLDGADVRRGID